MPLTIDQKIVDELKLRLAAITIANGFQTNLGWNGGTEEAPNEIEEWPTQYQGEELISARVGLFDLPRKKSTENPNEESVINTMPCQVRIFHKRGTTPAELRVFIGDVEKGIVRNRTTGKRDLRLNRLAISVLSDEVGFIVPEDTFQIDGAAVQFKVQFLTDPFSSYE